MTVVTSPFIVARCDAYMHLGLDSEMEIWDVDRLLMEVARRALHLLFPAMIEVEARIAAAPAEEEWTLVAELFEVCPFGLRIEPASITGISLDVEGGSLSKHEHMLLLDALEATLAETAADPSSWPKPALAHYSHTP